jgi:[FeFe] hydrogenase H-cluster maturation GTPase HydF
MPNESIPHIGIFGKRNSGKSSLINILSGQDIAIVSEVPGTTTDPVRKRIEIQDIGASVVIDTAGIDDEGELGKKRIQKSLQVLKNVDLAVLVITGNEINEHDTRLMAAFREEDVPFFIVHNKSDIDPLQSAFRQKLEKECDVIDFSTLHPLNRDQLFALLKKHIPVETYSRKSLLGGIVNHGDIILLITPIDIEAPEGRIILPQVQTIRDALDNDCVTIVLKEREVDSFLARTGIRPNLVVTDSQVFLKADASIPKDIPLTSFSILLARFKGDFENYLKGTPKLAELKEGDRILILESCTHQVSCDDIGRVKIPRWISAFSGKQLSFDFVSGLDHPPHPITEYALVIQCGGCMITRKQLMSRLKPAIKAGIPVTNYGMTIAFVQGIYQRAVKPFMHRDERAADYL